MTIKEKVGNIASVSLGITFVIIFLAIALILWWGGIAVLMWICDAISPYISPINSWTTAVCIFILLPLFIFRKAKVLTYYGFSISAGIYSFLLFVGSTIIVYTFWGATGVSIGIFLGGVAVIPMALLALLVNGKLGVLGMTLVQCAFAIGAIVLAAKCSDRLKNDDVYDV